VAARGQMRERAPGQNLGVVGMGVDGENAQGHRRDFTKNDSEAGGDSAEEALAVALRREESYKEHGVPNETMNRHKLLILSATVLLAFCTACSTEAPKEAATKKEVKPVAPVSGQTASFEMYKVARLWAGDAALLKLENLDIPEAKPLPGKYGAWKATFASFQKRLKREYMYSVAESSSGAHKGVFPGPEVPYVPIGAIRIFNFVDVKTDTPEALENALKQKDVAAFAAKHPELPVQFILEWSMVTPRPAWRVYWGGTVSTSEASVYIDAGDGKFLKKQR
jgi:hypothetical protein